MFTGIITNLGTIESLSFNREKDLLLKVSAAKNQIKRKLEIGCSIAINGICLTLIEKKISAQKVIFSFQASKETLARTSLKNWKISDLVNLEFAMRLGDEFGGHIVLGHVDEVAKIKAIKPIKDSFKFTFETKKSLMKFITEKGSVTLNGVSLTINEVNKNSFSVNLIKHTINHTNFKNSQIGDLVNLEIDLIARYLEKISKKND